MLSKEREKESAEFLYYVKGRCVCFGPTPTEEMLLETYEEVRRLRKIVEAAVAWRDAKEALATAPRARAGQENHEQFESAIGRYMAAEEALLDALEDD